MIASSLRLGSFVFLLLLGIVCLSLPAATSAFDDDDPAKDPIPVKDADSDDPFDETEKPLRPRGITRPTKSKVGETPKEGISGDAATRRKAPTLGPREIRLHLTDNSIIAGQLSVDEITVDTEFGKLVVPVKNIVSFRPGLSSYPELSQKIAQLLEDLGSDDYQKRQQSHKDLVRWGLKVQHEVARFANDKNTERKRHITEILKEFEEMADEQDEEEETEPAWIQQDTVVTRQFTIVGKIVQDSFHVTSKYGPLTIKLSDVRMGDRNYGAMVEKRKSFSVSGQNLVQFSFKSSGLRVQRGDKITVKADGNIVMSPWGRNKSSSPDGGPTFGWYVPNKISGGTLVAKIGDSGKVFKVGSKHTFVATKSGTLKFAVAMQHQYAQEGYDFPGQYNVKVKVESEQP